MADPDPETLYVATESFIVEGDSAAQGVTLRWGSDDLVQRFPQFFVVSHAHARPTVEAATAGPGEVRGADEPPRRGPGRPRKDATAPE